MRGFYEIDGVQTGTWDRLGHEDLVSLADFLNRSEVRSRVVPGEDERPPFLAFDARDWSDEWDGESEQHVATGVILDAIESHGALPVLTGTIGRPEHGGRYEVRVHRRMSVGDGYGWQLAACVLSRSRTCAVAATAVWIERSVYGGDS